MKTDKIITTISEKPSSLEMTGTDVHFKMLTSQESKVQAAASSIFEKSSSSDKIITKKPVKLYTGTADCSYNTPKVTIPDQLQLSDTEKAELTQACLEHYGKSMQVLQRESIYDALVSNKAIQTCTAEPAKRLLILLQTLSEVVVEMELQVVLPEASSKLFQAIKNEKQNQEQALNTMLNFYFKSNPQTLNYDGNIGDSPEALIAVLTDGNFREQMFLLGESSKRLLKDLSKAQGLVGAINKKLSNSNSSWTLELDERFEKPGVHAAKTAGEKLRTMNSDFKQKLEIWKIQNNPTIKALTSGPIPLSIHEIKYATKGGSLSLDTQINWDVGSPIFTPVTFQDEGRSENKYLEAAHMLKMDLMTGISNSTDQKLSAVHSLGINTKEALFTFLLGCIASFRHSHSVLEVLIVGRSFGLDIEIGPDFYRQMPLILSDLENAQKKRGFQLPDYYLNRKTCVEFGKAMINADNSLASLSYLSVSALKKARHASYYLYSATKCSYNISAVLLKSILDRLHFLGVVKNYFYIWKRSVNLM